MLITIHQQHYNMFKKCADDVFSHLRFVLMLKNYHIACNVQMKVEERSKREKEELKKKNL